MAPSASNDSWASEEEEEVTIYYNGQGLSLLSCLIAESGGMPLTSLLSFNLLKSRLGYTLVIGWINSLQGIIDFLPWDTTVARAYMFCPHRWK